MRYGIVGCGLMGREHLRSLALLPEAEIVALADPDAGSMAEAAALAPGAARHGDVAALLAAGGLDAVVVATPNHTHRAMLAPILDAGPAILAEKPLATTLADARWLAARAAAHPRPVQIGMEYRFAPPAAAFIAAVADGAVGTLRMLAIREHRFPFLSKVGDWNRFAAASGGTMVEKCCHFFDLMRLIVAAEPVRLYCSGAIDLNHREERYGGRVPDIIDNAYAVVDFANGVRAMLDLCMFAEGAPHQEEMSAVGDVARLDLLMPPGELRLHPRSGEGWRRLVAVDPAAEAAGAHHGATYHQHLAFAAACRGEAAVAVTADDGLRAVAMGLAAEESARSGRAVALADLL